jgi:hypothetical protein
VHDGGLAPIGQQDEIIHRPDLEMECHSEKAAGMAIVTRPYMKSCAFGVHGCGSPMCVTVASERAGPTTWPTCRGSWPCIWVR